MYLPEQKPSKEAILEGFIAVIGINTMPNYHVY